jgi:hypothetical protein
MIGNLKRIARRPSLLLKGPKSTSSPGDTESEEFDSFGSEQGGPQKDSQSKPLTRVENLKQKSKEIARVLNPSPDESRGLKAVETSRLPSRRTNRRASTGGSMGSLSLSASCHTDMRLSFEQKQRIERLKNRRRNSTTMTHTNNALSAVSSHSHSSAEEEVQSMSPARARRHSLTFAPNSQQPKPLYTVLPDTERPKTRKLERRMSNEHRTLSFVRRNSMTTSKDKSMRSIGSTSVQTHDTHRSGSSHRSNGSAFSSTGWSVVGGIDSPRKSPRRTARKKIAGLKSSTCHNIGRSLYMPTYESNRSLDSIKSFESDW